MIRNYLLVMVRSMMQRKFHTTINVLCLTIGISFALVIGLFIHGELQVNHSLKDVDQLFLVENTVNGQSTNVDFFTPATLSKTATEEYPIEFVDYYRFWDRSITVSKGDNHFRVQSMIGDASFLRMFGFKVLQGDTNDPLKEPNTIIITEEIARKYFNRTNVAGETLSIFTELNGAKDFKITAVIAEPDAKNTISDLMNMKAQIFLSLENAQDFFAQSNPDGWQDFMISYVRLTTTEKTKAEQTLNELLSKQAPQSVSENRFVKLVPLSDYYLITNRGAAMKLIISLSVIAGFIMILAVTNFINISVSNAIARLKEVGVRKVIGGSRRQLLTQFLIESISLTLISGVVSLFVYQLVYPLFNELLTTQLPSVTAFDTVHWISIISTTILIGLLAGIYPAFFQSATKPIESFKGKSKSVQGNMSFSKILIAAQFVITIFISTSALVLSKQTDFFLESDLGYNTKNVLIVSSVPRWWNEEGFQKLETAKNEFMKSGKVKSVSLSWGAPSWGIGGYESSVYRADESPETLYKATIAGADEHFNKVFDIEMKEGYFLINDNESFSPRRVTINESASKAMRLKVGDQIKFPDMDDFNFTVTGITNNFNYESMHQTVKPLIFMHNRDYQAFRFLSLHMDAASPAQAVEEAERLWKQVFPNEAFTYHFADERLRAIYATELQLKKASSVATVLMLIMVITGLLGLVALNVSKRTKEIGIRKVLGASVSEILTMFSKEYAKLMMLSLTLAIPLAYYFSYTWLNSFAYRISLEWWLLVIPGAFLTLLTLLLVALQSYQSAAADPVRSLRRE